MITNFMQESLKEAKLALSIGEVPVGCVFVFGNRIIARAGNYVNATKNPTRHAEMICIDKTYEFCQKNYINEEQYFSNVSVIVTVEPCIMCAAALYNLNVKEIIYGCGNDRFGGMTVLNVEKLLDKQIPIVKGVEADEAMALLKQFYKGQNPSAPIAIRK